MIAGRIRGRRGSLRHDEFHVKPARRLRVSEPNTSTAPARPTTRLGDDPSLGRTTDPELVIRAAWRPAPIADRARRLAEARATYRHWIADSPGRMTTPQSPTMSTVASCVLVFPRRVSTHSGAASSMQRCSDELTQISSWISHRTTHCGRPSPGTVPATPTDAVGGRPARSLRGLRSAPSRT